MTHKAITLPALASLVQHVARQLKKSGVVPKVDDKNWVTDEQNPNLRLAAFNPDELKKFWKWFQESRFKEWVYPELQFWFVTGDVPPQINYEHDLLAVVLNENFDERHFQAMHRPLDPDGKKQGFEWVSVEPGEVLPVPRGTYFGLTASAEAPLLVLVGYSPAFDRAKEGGQQVH